MCSTWLGNTTLEEVVTVGKSGGQATRLGRDTQDNQFLVGSRWPRGFEFANACMRGDNIRCVIVRFLRLDGWWRRKRVVRTVAERVMLCRVLFTVSTPSRDGDLPRSATRLDSKAWGDGGVSNIFKQYHWVWSARAYTLQLGSPVESC